jgi:hypothetical protein
VITSRRALLTVAPAALALLGAISAVFTQTPG